MAKLNCFIQDGSRFYAHPETTMVKELPTGAYQLIESPFKGVIFEQFTIKSDNVLTLSSPELTKLVKEFDLFLAPKKRKQYKDLGYLYKRSCLLYGLPGVGKTCLINKIAQSVIDRDGIVLFIDSFLTLKDAYATLAEVQQDKLVLVIIEEVDHILDRQAETALSILDGQIQQENVIYLATTNNIDAIRTKFLRPGRFSTTIEMKVPSDVVRYEYLKQKTQLPDEQLKPWVKATENLTLDDLKELVQSVLLLEIDFDTALTCIKNTKATGRGLNGR